MSAFIFMTTGKSIYLKLLINCFEDYIFLFLGINLYKLNNINILTKLIKLFNILLHIQESKYTERREVDLLHFFTRLLYK